MNKRRTVVVVDGSNLATEGRLVPSLRQLDEAVTAFQDERPDADMVVVVDATFGHRVAAAERVRVKEAELSGEIVTPPAGAIGRGDAFILKIAKRAGASVLSNDSFQEFHAEHPWLFEEGRLIGGKPVPRVGWIFTPRNPVRGQKSKAVTTKAARDVLAAPKVGDVLPAPRARTAQKRAVAPAAPADPQPSSRQAPKAAKATKPAAKQVDKQVDKQLAGQAEKPVGRQTAKRQATKAAATAAVPASGRRTAGVRARAGSDAAAEPRQAKTAAKRSGTAEVKSSQKEARGGAGNPAPAVAVSGGPKAKPEPVNTLRSFQALASEHAVGGLIEGEVVQFTSHGAMISVRAGRRMHVVCYAPLAGLGSPPPTRARDILKRGEVARFRIVAFDETRRRAELALAPS